MGLPLYQIDAFASRRFEGNPAAVVVMEGFPDDTVLQGHAAEHQLPETAFLVRDGSDYRLRWFTPRVEVPLCGHATLASAAVVLERLEPGRERVVFHTASGPLTVTHAPAAGVGGYVMDFPLRHCRPVALPEGLADALRVSDSAIVEVAHDGFNWVARLVDEASVRELRPDLDAIAALVDVAGVIVTAVAAPPYDIVSRYFAPAKGIPEDPVTGGAHCALAHFWSERLGRNELRAWQASARGGAMVVRRLPHDRVALEGRCVFYAQGEICGGA